MCGCLCERIYCKLGTCSGRQVQGHVPVTVPTYNKGPEQWKHCSSGTKVCEPDCPHVHLLPAAANSFSQGEKDGGQYIFLKGRVGPSILMWNGQNRESEVNVKPWWITGMHYHIFSFTESIKKISCRLEIKSAGGSSHPACASSAYESLCTGGNRKNCVHHTIHVIDLLMSFSKYLSRCHGTSMQHCQQTAEGRGADGSSDAACVPHQVRKQDVTQKPLWIVMETPRMTHRKGGKRHDKSAGVQRRHLLYVQYSNRPAPKHFWWCANVTWLLQHYSYTIMDIPTLAVVT